jgi:hypothetical protein
MTYIQSHHKHQSSQCSIPSSKPTPFLFLNLMMNRIVHQPQDHPANPNTPPISSATGGPVISHIRHYIISSTWDLLQPLPSQSLANLSMINIQALSLKSKNTATVKYTLAPKKPSPITLFHGRTNQEARIKGNSI